jgi:hypothetical protein
MAAELAELATYKEARAASIRLADEIMDAFTRERITLQLAQYYKDAAAAQRDAMAELEEAVRPDPDDFMEVGVTWRMEREHVEELFTKALALANSLFRARGRIPHGLYDHMSDWVPDWIRIEVLDGRRERSERHAAAHRVAQMAGRSRRLYQIVL